MLYAKLMLIVFGSILALSLVTAIGRSLRRGIGEWQRAAERRQREAAAQEEAERREAERAENERLAQEQKAAAAEARKAKQAEAKAKAAARDAERKAKQAERVEAARQIAEYNERALIAARELKAIEAKPAMDAAPQDKPRELVDIELPSNGECPGVLYDLMQTQPDESKPVEKTEAAPALPQTFAGQVVAFTGKLKGMTRRQAAEQVNARGGRGCVKEMPVGTTILVVGDGVENSGKMQKADRWAGQQRVISQTLFFEMLNAV